MYDISIIEMQNIHVYVYKYVYKYYMYMCQYFIHD